MSVSLRLADRVLSLDRPVVMGVLNVTPDSFSDGGSFLDAGRAVEHGERLADEGASIVDVGGESTRPGADPVPVEEELRRVLPVVGALAGRGVVVSIDTRHAEVAARAVDEGASIVNDVSGLRDPRLRAVCAARGVPVVVMHSPVDDPSAMQRHARYDDVVADVARFLAERVEVAHADGIEQIVVDPGIGFGKTTEHNLELVRRLDELVSLGAPVLVGASRKRFVGEITGVDEAAHRLAGTLAVHLACLDRGARIVRAHDVAEHVQAIRMWDALHPS